MATLDAGETVREVAEALSVAPSSDVKWSQRLRSTGGAAPGKIGGHVRHKINGADAAWLRTRIAAGPFTWRGLVAELAVHGLHVYHHTMWNVARAEGPSFTKNRNGQRAGPSRRGSQAPAMEEASGQSRRAAACIHR